MVNDLLKLIESYPKFSNYSARCDSKAGIDYSIACQEWEKKLVDLDFKKFLDKTLSMELALKDLLRFFGDGSTDNEWEDENGNSIENILKNARLLMRETIKTEIININEFDRNSSIFINKALSGVNIQVVDGNKKVILNLNRE